MGGFGLGRTIVLAAILGAGAAGAATVQVKAGDTTPDAGGCGSKANPCDTIQAGVDAAATGDVVNVAKGDYAENVAVLTPGIRLRGAGALLGAPLAACPGDAARVNIAACEGLGVQLSCDAAWQPIGDPVPRATSCFWTGAVCAPCDAAGADALGCTNSCTAVIPAALTIAADDVSVEKLRVRAPPLVGIGVEDGADGVALRGVRVEGAGDACIAGDGDRLAVSGSIARSCEGGGIVVDGAGAALDKNRVAGTNGAALRVRGPGASLTRNTVAGVAAACARVDGDGATVDRNRLSACGGVGIDARGSGLRISKNQVRSADTGLDVSCRADPHRLRGRRAHGDRAVRGSGDRAGVRGHRPADRQQRPHLLLLGRDLQPLQPEPGGGRQLHRRVPRDAGRPLRRRSRGRKQDRRDVRGRVHARPGLRRRPSARAESALAVCAGRRLHRRCRDPRGAEHGDRLRCGRGRGRVPARGRRTHVGVERRARLLGRRLSDRHRRERRRSSGTRRSRTTTTASTSRVGSPS